MYVSCIGSFKELSPKSHSVTSPIFIVRCHRLPLAAGESGKHSVLAGYINFLSKVRVLLVRNERMDIA